MISLNGTNPASTALLQLVGSVSLHSPYFRVRFGHGLVGIRQSFHELIEVAWVADTYSSDETTSLPVHEHFELLILRGCKKYLLDVVEREPNLCVAFRNDVLFFEVFVVHSSIY